MGKKVIHVLQTARHAQNGFTFGDFHSIPQDSLPQFVFTPSTLRRLMGVTTKIAMDTKLPLPKWVDLDLDVKSLPWRLTLEQVHRQFGNKSVFFLHPWIAVVVLKEIYRETKKRDYYVYGFDIETKPTVLHFGFVHAWQKWAVNVYDSETFTNATNSIILLPRFL